MNNLNHSKILAARPRAGERPVHGFHPGAQGRTGGELEFRRVRAVQRDCAAGQPGIATGQEDEAGMGFGEHEVPELPGGGPVDPREIPVRLERVSLKSSSPARAGLEDGKRWEGRCGWGGGEVTAGVRIRWD